ncbi:MAG: acyl-CoA thioesterase [Lachnospiraceae bacterium]|nr:acyl-CoA thioesterase [Lachnospiraceae bacterium]
MSNEIKIHEPKEFEIKPYIHHTKYHETNQQGIINHSNYINWMEDARMNMLEQMGLGFKQMEELEITSPVLAVSIEYRSAVKFDDSVVIETKCLSYDGHKMEIAYRMYDKETGEDRAVAKSTHCFLNKSGVPISVNRIYPELDTKGFTFT